MANVLRVRMDALTSTPRVRDKGSDEMMGLTKGEMPRKVEIEAHRAAV